MTSFTKSFAIAIGINQYQNSIAELNTAKPDAETLADILRDDYQYQVELITDDTDRKPTLKELENLLAKWLPEKLQPPAENNRLLFYFAGHGMPLESDDGPRGFLLPQDADPKDSKTFLPMQVLHDALVALPCHHLLVILDCCFAGTFRWASTRKMIPIPETIHREHYDRFIRYRAWQAITSAAHNQEALDFLSDKRGIGAKSQHQGIQHSPFAEALFEALQDGDPDEKGRRYKKADLTKDGVITAPELYLYLRDNVETRSGDRQTPGLYPLQKHDRGEYIFHDPNFDRESLSEADPIDETNNPYRGLKPFEEEHARFFFGRQELIENLYARIVAPDRSLTVVLGVSGSGKSSLVKAGLIPYLRELSKPNNDLNQWHILNPIRPGESPFAALARTIWAIAFGTALRAIADLPTSVQLDSLGFLSEKLNEETKELNTQVAKASNEHGETSRTTQRLKQEAEKLAQITTTWNQDTHAAKQQSIVEHFETLYALCQTEGEPESQQQQQLKQVFLACLNPLTERLQSAPNSFVEIVKAWSQKRPGVKLLLVIDQFEELITLTRKAQPNPQSDTPEEWQQFLQLLETTLAANLPQLRIIVTLRSDFEPRFLNSEALKSYWTKARFPVRAMRSDELRQAIEGPASEMALYFEPANLVDRLIDEVGQMPGALPLLSFTLSELYIKLKEKWRGESSDRALTIDAEFDKEGGVAGSLTRRANEEYNKLGEAAQQTMRRVMLRMLTLEGGETARRRVPESELVYPTPTESDRVKEVVDELVEARLLVKGQLETGEPYVEPAHDFLVRGWGILQNWIDEEKAQETLELQQRLTAQANDWAINQGPLLPDGDRLNQLEKILALADNWLNQRETQFIKNSIDYRDIQQKQTKELRVRAELRQKATKVEDLLPVQPLDGLVLAIQTMGQNLDELPQEILAPVQTSLHKVMRTARPAIPFQGHEGNVSAVAFSSDGQLIVTGSVDNTLRLWDIKGNPVSEPLRGHESHISAVAFSPNGKLIVSGSYDNTIWLWDIQGNPIGKLFGKHENYVSSVAFSPDGQMIVSGSYDSTVRLWSIEGKSIEKLFLGHKGAVHSVAFSPNGQTISSGGADETVRLWDIDGNLIGEPLRKHMGDVYSIAFSRDGQRIVSGSKDETIQIWDIQGHPIGEAIRGHKGAVLSVTFSPNGQMIASNGAEGIVRLWDIQGNPIGEPLQRPGGYVRGTAFSFGDAFSSERQWLDTPIWMQEGFIYSVAFSPDGQMIISGSEDNTMQCWDIKSDLIDQPLQGHEDAVWSVAISPDGKAIASGSRDKTVRLWDIKGNPIGEPLQRHISDVNSVAFSPNSQMIVSGGWGGRVYLWDIEGNPIGESLPENYLSLHTVAFSPNGYVIVSANSVEKATLESGMQVSVPKDVLRFWDIQGNPIGEPVEMFYNTRVQSVAVSPDGQMIASAGYEGTVQLWDIQGNPISQTVQKHEDRVNALAFSPDGKMVVSGSRDKTVRLWDIKGNLIGNPFRGHDDGILSVAFSPNGLMIASGGLDETVRLWDIQGNPISEPLQGHQGSVLSVVFSPDSQMIVSGSADKTVRLWRGGWRAWLEVCCDRLRYHPVFKNPQTDIEKQACETCQKYVWSQEDTSV